jgi:hypothetical protein
MDPDPARILKNPGQGSSKKDYVVLNYKEIFLKIAL